MAIEQNNQNWTFFYDTAHLQNEVENITATVASRPVGDSAAMRTYLIMNADQTDLFERLVKDAMSEVRNFSYRRLWCEHHSYDSRHVDRLHIHAKIEVEDDVPVTCDADYTVHGERAKRDDDEQHYIPPIIRTIDDALRMWLIWRVVLGWFELKAPEELQWISPKVAEYRDTLKTLMRTGGKTTRRTIRYWQAGF